ncbi:MAG: hypothetical protein PHG58_11995 [Clostridia bacterium]|nr:hypothetical protein [Clostridia bacterium]
MAVIIAEIFETVDMLFSLEKANITMAPRANKNHRQRECKKIFQIAFPNITKS